MTGKLTSADIIRLAEEGKTLTEIAKNLSLPVHSVRHRVLALGLRLRDGRTDRKGTHDQARADAIAERYKRGETLQRIGDSYGISRERVRQILRKCTPVLERDGGAAVVAEQKRRDQAARRDQAYMEKFGCGWEEYKRIRDISRGRLLEELKPHVEAGGSLRSFCQAYKVCKYTVYRLAHEAGLDIRHGPHRDLSYRLAMIERGRADGLSWARISGLMAKIEGRPLSEAAAYLWARKHAPHLIDGRPEPRGIAPAASHHHPSPSRSEMTI